MCVQDQQAMYLCFMNKPLYIISRPPLHNYLYLFFHAMTLPDESKSEELDFPIDASAL